MTTAVDREAEQSETTDAMTHRQVLQALSGLFMAMFVAMLSATIVANALPRIIADLGGNQSQYTWVVTATLLAATATTPIWGKLADRMSKKLLVQLAIVIFVTGSVLAGFSQNTETLIGFRVLQGVGMGGLQALVQIVLGSVVSPRQRGRYMGYIGAVMAVATVGGPLLGGFIVDTSFLGWRWCFWVGVPVAIIALVLLQKTLHLPVVKAHTKIDWLGAMLIPGGVTVLLLWVTFAGGEFAWLSWTTVVLVSAALMLISAAVWAERRVSDPVVPPRLLRERTMVLSIIASAAVGIAMFGGPVFFGQYFQIARGYSPTEAGLLTIPMVGGLLLASTITGQIISRTGRWKRFLVGGTALTVVGLALLGTIDHATSLWQVGVFMAVLGIGIGSTMQNLVLAVQNGLAYRDLGAGTSAVTFFRSLGGAAGVSVLGAILASHVTDLINDGLKGNAAAGASTQTGGSTSLDLSELPPSVRVVVEHAYGDGTALVFVIGAVVAVFAFVAVLFLRETALRTTVNDGSRAGGDGSTRAEDEGSSRTGAEGSSREDVVTRA
ncbi:MDR family MFS transporter [Phytoactinopolyspora endophytica]|uniref:MDR family MFS transporter n=1 Tax=Phytoactinopolyspora endophytica TaxID=1642495 RepID=UPI00197B2237|nr:MDR family MFS transporter [Phytoactinopolyspora endophytica]